METFLASLFRLHPCNKFKFFLGMSLKGFTSYRWSASDPETRKFINCPGATDEQTRSVSIIQRDRDVALLNTKCCYKKTGMGLVRFKIFRGRFFPAETTIKRQIRHLGKWSGTRRQNTREGLFWWFIERGVKRRGFRVSDLVFRIATLWFAPETALDVVNEGAGHVLSHGSAGVRS